MVKTQGCGSCIRGFESHYPPHFIQIRRHSQVVRQRSAKPLFPSSNLGVASKSMGYRQAVRQRILIPSFAGSNPATLANKLGLSYESPNLFPISVKGYESLTSYMNGIYMNGIRALPSSSSSGSSEPSGFSPSFAFFLLWIPRQACITRAMAITP